MRKFVIVTTCKGRLAHLKQTAPLVMESIKDRPNWQWLVVDYDCPDDTRHWLTDEHPDAIVVAVDKAPKFNKPSALNIGAATAFGHLNANYVVFQDADTIVKDPEIYEWIEDNAAPDSFLIYPSDGGTKDLTGFLALGKKAFIDSLGFDVAFDVWGGEDLEYRLRLYLLLGYFFDEVPPDFLGSIAHSDQMRTQFQGKQDVELLKFSSLDKIFHKFATVLQKPVQEAAAGEDGRYILRLLGILPDLSHAAAGGTRARHAINSC